MHAGELHDFVMWRQKGTGDKGKGAQKFTEVSKIKAEKGFKLEPLGEPYISESLRESYISESQASAVVRVLD